jgi:RNA polymerase sigma-70 factor (ECF subfamily)
MKSEPLPHSKKARSEIETTVRKEWGRILASLTKTLGDLQLAEDSLQDAVESALQHWGKNGLPNSPPAWLIQTARRKAIDRLRRVKNFSGKEKEITYLMELDALDAAKDHLETSASDIPDKRLEMIFTCCHPSIEEKSRIALTLRTIGGLTTQEIASAFLDKTEAMAARLTRAKKKIALAGIPYEIPKKEILADRLRSVVDVIYLIYNEGYSSSHRDELIRSELCDEALRLSALIASLMPDQTEAQGLHALILLHDSRRPSRLDDTGNFVSLKKQDRSKWNRENIKAGKAILEKVLTKGAIGPYQLQAAISACHAEAEAWFKTDWGQILALYDLLYALEPSPVIRLNQAYALSNHSSCEEALVWLHPLEGDLNTYQPFHVAKANFLKRIGKFEEAKQALLKAISLSTNHQEKQHLVKTLAQLGTH